MLNLKVEKVVRRLWHHQALSDLFVEVQDNQRNVLTGIVYAVEGLIQLVSEWSPETIPSNTELWEQVDRELGESKRVVPFYPDENPGDDWTSRAVSYLLETSFVLTQLAKVLTEIKISRMREMVDGDRNVSSGVAR